MTTSPRHGYTELTAGQSIPETTVNANDRSLEQGANLFAFVSRTTTAQPGSPVEGDCYLLTGSPTGASWSSHANEIAHYQGTAGWRYITPKNGMMGVVLDESAKVIVRSGGSWVTNNQLESFVIACSDETTALTTGTNKTKFRMPYGFIVTAVRASLSTAQTSGSIFTVDINESGTSILSTKLTIDNTETTSQSAATAAVISDANIADDAEISIDIDQVGDGTAKGLKVVIIGRQS